MIPEIPVRTRQVLDIGSEADEGATRLEAPARLDQRVPQRLLGRQVLEEVAGEDHVEAGVGDLPRYRAVLLEEGHIRREPALRFGIQIHPVPCLRLDVVDELTPPASQVED